MFFLIYFRAAKAKIIPVWLSLKLLGIITYLGIIAYYYLVLYTKLQEQ